MGSDDGGPIADGLPHPHGHLFVRAEEMTDVLRSAARRLRVTADNIGIPRTRTGPDALADAFDQMADYLDLCFIEAVSRGGRV